MQKTIAIFSEQLGWGVPQAYQHTIPGEKQSEQLVWYEAGDIGNPRTDLFLQINELGPEVQNHSFSAAVYAPRYRICTGWQIIELKGSTEELVVKEAERLNDWLHKKNFLTLNSRRDFRLRHPETADYSWPKIREYGPPYFVRVRRQKHGIKVERCRSDRCKSFLKGAKKATRRG